MKLVGESLHPMVQESLMEALVRSEKAIETRSTQVTVIDRCKAFSALVKAWVCALVQLTLSILGIVTGFTLIKYLIDNCIPFELTYTNDLSMIP